MRIVKSYNKFFEKASEFDPYGEEDLNNSDNENRDKVDYLDLVYRGIPVDYPLYRDKFHDYMEYDDGEHYLQVRWSDGDSTIEVEMDDEKFTYYVEDYQKCIDAVISWFIRNDIPADENYIEDDGEY
jgi:hypothetical protein